MRQQDGVDLGRVDVHTSRDDHLGRAPREEEIAVVVDVPMVTQGEVVAPVAALGLLVVLVITETPLRRRPQVHGADLVGAEQLTLIRLDVHQLGVGRLPHRSRLREPVLRPHESAAALGGGVVLVDDGPEPVHEALLHMDGAGRGAVDDEAQRRHVVLVPGLLGQCEETVEHRGHHVGVRDLVLLDQSQRLLGVPAVHQHHSDPGHQGRVERERQGRGVVQRSCAEVGVGAGRVAGGDTDVGGQRARVGRARGSGGGTIDALRATGRARRVEHRPSEDGVVDVVARFRCDDGFVVVEAIDGPGDGQADLGVGRQRRRLRRVGGEAGVGDEGLGLAVVHDVGGLLAGEVPVDGGHAYPHAQARSGDLGELRPVGAHEGDGVAGAEALRPQRAHEAVGVGVELAEGPVAVGRRDGHAIGRVPRVKGEGHARAGGFDALLERGAFGMGAYRFGFASAT